MVKNISFFIADTLSELQLSSQTDGVFYVAETVNNGFYTFQDGVWVSQLLTNKRDVKTGFATVDFGSGAGMQGDTATVAVTQGWITPTSRINLSMALTSNVDHDAEDAVLEQLDPIVINKTTGSFDIICYAPLGTYGRFDVVWSGR